MPNYKSFLVTEAERKHVRRRKRFQQHRDATCHYVFFFLKGKAPKKIHAILREAIGEHEPSYGTVKNWVVLFKRGDFSTCDAPRPGRRKTVIGVNVTVGIFVRSTVHTHHGFKITLPKHRPSTRQTSVNHYEFQSSTDLYSLMMDRIRSETCRSDF